MSVPMDTVLLQTALLLEFLGIDGFNPVVSESGRWIRWVTNVVPTTCSYCAEQNGKVYDKQEPPPIEPPVHPRCGCSLKALLAILAGTATISSNDGADYWIKYFQELPSGYITKEVAKKAGWVNIKGNLQSLLPGAIIGGDSYGNRELRLPNAPGRIWYEADINYTGGYRNKHRLLYSNDGLIFVTYDHCKTFYEIA